MYRMRSWGHKPLQSHHDAHCHSGTQHSRKAQGLPRPLVSLPLALATEERGPKLKQQQQQFSRTYRVELIGDLQEFLMHLQTNLLALKHGRTNVRRWLLAQTNFLFNTERAGMLGVGWEGEQKSR